MEASRWWGGDRALLDEDEGRQRLLEAAGRCIERRGNIQIRMAEVGREAGVVRSTVYRYFPSRDDLLLALILHRADTLVGLLVEHLPNPTDAANTIPDMVILPVEAVDADPLYRAMFDPESADLTPVLETGADAVAEVIERHVGPLFESWQASGQVHADLDRREVLQWIQSVSRFLLTPLWRARSAQDKRRFVDQFVVRALVIGQ